MCAESCAENVAESAPGPPPCTRGGSSRPPAQSAPSPTSSSPRRSSLLPRRSGCASRYSPRYPPRYSPRQAGRARARARERVRVGSAGRDWGAPAVHVEDSAEEVRLERVLAQRLRVRLERVPLAEIPCARRREPRDLGARVGVLRRRQQNVGDKRSGSNSGNGSGNETCSRPDSHSSAASAQSPSQSASACWQRIRPSVSSRLLLWPCSDCRRSYASRASAQRCSFSYHSSRSVTYTQSQWLRVGPAGVRSE